MKRYVIAFLGMFLVMGSVWAAEEDNQIIDALAELEDEMPGDIQELNEEFNLSTFSSCEDMSTVLENYIKENFQENWRYGYGYGIGGGIMEGDAVARPAPTMANQGDIDTAVAEETEAARDDGAKSTSDDFSTTNIQVEGVDEADILKSDGEYLYYYNQRLQQILILKSPLDLTTSSLNLADAELIKKINLPSHFQGSQLYLEDNKLVIIANRWSNVGANSFLDRGNKIDVIVYDVSNVEKPKLVKFSDVDGYYSDSRLIDGKLYLVSQLNVNRRWAFNGLEKLEDINISADDLLPKAIDISYTQTEEDQNLTIAGQDFPYRVGVHKPSCDSIFYVLPDQETVKQFGLHPSFTVVRVIDIDDTEEEIQTSTAFGSTQTIHMSQEALYLTNYFWMPYPFSCPPNARCILPWYDQGANTLIHKFGLQDGGNVSYVNSTIVEGEPLSQYSMSEDSEGNFRILTKTWTPQLATHLAVLDESLDAVGLLRNIEPGEEFKSSRYIGDKLYLVTFEQTDPLFVIDIADITDPKIVGELVIPGYSTYLHPYADMENNVQYLIGLGVQTEESEWGGVVPAGIKVDLYEIDYNDIDGAGLVHVEQLHTQTWGGRGSDTEALYNPRMFVWDEERQLLVLPMILQKEAGGEYCNIEYDANGKEIGRWCQPSYRYTTTFAGMKAIQVDVDGGIDERYSYDYTQLLKQDKQAYYDSRQGEIYPRQFQNLQFRVGYVGDALFAINNLFAHFAVMGTDNEVYVDFDAMDVSNNDGWAKPMPVDVVAIDVEESAPDVAE